MQFDKDLLTAELAKLPSLHQVAFAASCCERLLPNYLAFCTMEQWGKPVFLKQMLGTIWDYLEGQTFDSQQLSEWTTIIREVIPHTEDFFSLFVSVALRAATSIIYTLDCCLDRETNKVGMIADYAIGTLYQYLVCINDPETEGHIDDDNLYKYVMDAPLMQAELKKQQDDLQLLHSQQELTTPFLRQMRHASSNLGIQPFSGIRGFFKTSDLSSRYTPLQNSYRDRTFDTILLTGDLAKLSTLHQTAFAASCCERMIQNYYAFCKMESTGDPDFIGQVSQAIWEHLSGRQLSVEQVEDWRSKLAFLMPDTEEFWSLFVPAAGNAITALIFTLECCLQPHAEKAARAGGLCLGSTYEYLYRVNTPQIEAQENNTDFEQSLLNAPLMQAERKKQQDDLQQLRFQQVLTPSLLEVLCAYSTTAGIQPLSEWRGFFVDR